MLLWEEICIKRGWLIGSDQFLYLIPINFNFEYHLTDKLMTSYRTVLGKWSKLNSALPEFKSPHVSCVNFFIFFSFYEVHFSMAKLLKSTEFIERGTCGRETGEEQLPVTAATFSVPTGATACFWLINPTLLSDHGLCPSAPQQRNGVKFFFFNSWKATSGKQVADKCEPLQTSCYEMPRLHFSTLSLFLLANPA